MRHAKAREALHKSPHSVSASNYPVHIIDTLATFIPDAGRIRDDRGDVPEIAACAAPSRCHLAASKDCIQAQIYDKAHSLLSMSIYRQALRTALVTSVCSAMTWKTRNMG